jgi:hypothetical protein
LYSFYGGRGFIMTILISSVIYLIHYKNLCKCHNVPPPSTTIKGKRREERKRKQDLVMSEKNVYIHNGVLFTIKKNEIMLFAGKWMELEILMLSKVSQAQKNQSFHVFSHM